MKRLIDVWALVWSFWYLNIERPIMRWYRKHKAHPEYFPRMGLAVGILVTILMIVWGRTV